MPLGRCEPDRDASGYRRYGANDAIDLIKIRTLAEAGVPPARIRELRSAADEEFQQALQEIDDEVTARIRGLRETQGRLRRLAAGRPTRHGPHGTRWRSPPSRGSAILTSGVLGRAGPRPGAGRHGPQSRAPIRRGRSVRDHRGESMHHVDTPLTAIRRFLTHL
ncbi:MerR family transcriptional regulator [Streptomyces sp. NPDC059385]|uniref:MerR family transcriptional regulator n=1 Tax=Streptomyces sp. NPDC059385 TaxID=3346817 RepID=UPI0036B56896